MNKLIYISLALGIASVANAQDTSSAFSDVVDNNDGSFTNWIGTFTPAGGLSTTGYIGHAEHGSLYLAASGQDVWLYDANVAALGESFSGWIYTNRDLHPYFYVDATTPLYIIYLPGVMGEEPNTRVFLNTVDLSPLTLPMRTSLDIVSTAVNAGIFNTLATALTTANLVETLQMPGPYTVFAPTDDAFGKLDPALVNSLVTDPELLPTLTDILLYHVVPGELTAADLGFDAGMIFKGESTTRYLTTAQGSEIELDITPFGVMINDGIMVTTADVLASNGVIHIVDTVILPPEDIVDTAVDSGLSLLATALTEGALIETLQGDGPFTVFAPVNSAFEALGTETINTLFADENLATLQDILLFHVISGSAVYSGDVAPGMVTMANGDMAEITADMEGNLFIDGARIIETDIQTSNGVVHLIDTVMSPPED